MKKYLVKAIVGFAGLAMLGGVLAITIMIFFSFGLPKISSLADYKPAIPSRILSSDGTVLAEIALERREVAKFDEIPQLIVDAFLSAEDASFYDHSGVDYVGVTRAMFANLKAGKVVQGGSTITQQVAKSLLLTRERSFSRKIKDILLAQKIEERFSKKEILFLYLNQVYLGGGYYGVKAAFRGYFGKELSEATIAEAAMVAGLLVAPGRYSPYVNPKRATSRQRYVLTRLYENRIISEEQYKSALEEKIKFRLRRSNEFKAGYFTDWIRQRAAKLVGEDNLKTGGYSIQTTIDWELQQTAERFISKGVKEIDKRQGFKGPIGLVEKDNVEEFISKKRSDFYKNQSNFFTIGDNFERVYEIYLQEEELEPGRSHIENFRKIVKSKRWRPGYSENDPFLKNLKKGKPYQGIVEYVDNQARVIYVNVLGLKGIIPYEGFRWARKREISEKRHDFRYVTRPSSVVKEGDLILVQIEELKTNFSRVAHKGYEKSLKKLTRKARKFVKSQNFLKLMLDQEAEVQAALVSLNPFTGEVISFVGGSNFKKSQFNRAIQSHRQPGSSFKPLLFAAALENGFTPSSIIIDSPETLGGVDETLNWKPRNYDGRFKGPVTFRNSLEQSRNVPTIKIAYKMGVPLIHDYMERIGFKARLDPDLSLALGSFGVTLIDLTSTYAIFPNGGKKIRPKTILSITDRDGNSVPFEEIEGLADSEKLEAESQELAKVPTPETLPYGGDSTPDALAEGNKVNPFLATLGGGQVYDPKLAYIMTNLMRGVVLYGTGRRAKEVSPFLGGKTGTTNNYIDAWFMGFSSNLVTGVWTGFDENQTLGWGETGAKSALPIWKGFMRHGLKKFGEYDFKQPIGIVNVKVDKETGRLLTESSSRGFVEAFVEGTEPGTQKENSPFAESEEPANAGIFEEDEYYSSQ